MDLEFHSFMATHCFLQISIGKQWKQSLDHNETVGFIFHVCFLIENDPFLLLIVILLCTVFSLVNKTLRCFGVPFVLGSC